MCSVRLTHALGELLTPVSSSTHAPFPRLLIAGQTQFAGLRFSPTGVADAHHHTIRFGWALGANGSEPLVIGFDVAVLDEDGRIRAVYGFLDKVPAVL